MERHCVTFPAEGISRRGVADGRGVRCFAVATRIPRLPMRFRATPRVASLAMARCRKPVSPARDRLVCDKCARSRRSPRQQPGTGAPCCCRAEKRSCMVCVIMIQIALETPGRFIAVDGPRPRPAPGEALVRVHRVGVCGTDLHAFAGRQPFFNYPRILGHELGVEVVDPGSDPHGLKAGDRCSVEPYLNCGRCIACRAGRSNCCANLKSLGVHIDGGMRPEVVVPARKLHRSRRSPTTNSRSSRRSASAPTPSSARRSGRTISSSLSAQVRSV